MFDALKIVLGSDYSSLFTVKDDAGEAVDLTGATVTAALRHPWTKAPLDGAISVGILSATTGQCSIAMDETQTGLLQCGALQELVITVVSASGVTDIYLGALIEGL